MKKFTQIAASMFLAVALVTTTFAADTALRATSNAPVVIQTVSTPSTSLFNAKEFGISIGSGYDVGTASQINGKNLFTQPYNFNLTAGAFYFPWRNVGAEVAVPFYQSKGVSVSEVQFGTVLRLPLSKETPILKNISPYIGVGGVYSWTAKNELAYVGKVGTEFRINKGWGVAIEGQYRNSDLSILKQGNTSVNAFLRLVF